MSIVLNQINEIINRETNSIQDVFDLSNKFISVYDKNEIFKLNNQKIVQISNWMMKNQIRLNLSQTSQELKQILDELIVKFDNQDQIPNDYNYESLDKQYDDEIIIFYLQQNNAYDNLQGLQFMIQCLNEQKTFQDQIYIFTNKYINLIDLISQIRFLQDKEGKDILHKICYIINGLFLNDSYIIKGSQIYNETQDLNRIYKTNIGYDQKFITTLIQYLDLILVSYKDDFIVLTIINTIIGLYYTDQKLVKNYLQIMFELAEQFNQFELASGFLYRINYDYQGLKSNQFYNQSVLTPKYNKTEVINLDKFQSTRLCFKQIIKPTETFYRFEEINHINQVFLLEIYSKQKFKLKLQFYDRISGDQVLYDDYIINGYKQYFINENKGYYKITFENDINWIYNIDFLYRFDILQLYNLNDLLIHKQYYDLEYKLNFTYDNKFDFLQFLNQLLQDSKDIQKDELNPKDIIYKFEINYNIDGLIKLNINKQSIKNQIENQLQVIQNKQIIYQIKSFSQLDDNNYIFIYIDHDYIFTTYYQHLQNNFDNQQFDIDYSQMIYKEKTTYKQFFKLNYNNNNIYEMLNVLIHNMKIIALNLNKVYIKQNNQIDLNKIDQEIQELR